MAVQQTECYRVVTIGYLKNFISNLIQNSTGGTVTISRTDDTYCPTYSELTGGTIIQTWSQGSTPNGDRDGIVVNSSAILGGNYAANQLVDQKDLSLRYTRFNSLSIARSGSGNISECGGSATLTYTYNYKRYNKYMNDSCVTASSESTVDSVCGELGYHTTYGSVSNCTAYSIGKNGTVSASSRSDSIYADVTFRGTNHASNTVTITQNALSGSYSTYVSERTVTTAVSASRSSAYEFGCGGGTYSATGTRHYNTYTTYKWKDSCGTEYSDKTQERQTSTGSTQSLGSKSGTFGSVTCPTEDCSGSASLSFEYDGYSDSVSFIRTGRNSCVHCTCDVYALDPVSMNPHTHKAIGKYSSSDCSGNWNVTFIGGDSDVFSNISLENGIIYADNSGNYTPNSRSATYRIGIDSCSADVTFYQNSPAPAASCYQIILDGNHDVTDSGSWSDNDSSRILSDGRFGVWIYYDDITDSIVDSRTDLERYISNHSPSETYYSSSREDSVGPVTTDFSDQRTTWHNKCVCARLQYMAALSRGAASTSDMPECLLDGCEFSDYNNCNCEGIPCRDRCCDLGTFFVDEDPDIFYVKYTIAENTTGRNRLVLIFWYPAGQEASPWTCPSARIRVIQHG